MSSDFTGSTAADIQRRVQENLQRQQRLFEELAKKEIALPAGASSMPSPMQQADADRAFDKIDTNHDGVITRSEWLAATGASTANTPSAAASVSTQPWRPVGPEAPAPPALAVPSMPSMHIPPVAAPPMMAPPPIVGTAGIEKLVGDCWHRDNVIAEQMKQLHELRQKTDAAASGATVAQEQQQRAREEAEQLRATMQQEEQAYRSRVMHLEEETARAHSRAAQAETELQRGRVEGAASEQTVEVLQQELSEKSHQLAQAANHLEQAKADSRQAHERAEAAEGARRAMEMQMQMLVERNQMLESHIQALHMQAVNGTAPAAAAPPGQESTPDAITHQLVSELMALEQFIRSSAHQPNLGLFPGPQMPPSALAPPAAVMMDKCKRAAMDLVHETRGARGQIHELRVANDVNSTRANGLDASKAELHQELVEACRRLSELHNRVTGLEVENASMVSRLRESEDRNSTHEAELESRRRFVVQVCSQLIQAELSVRDVSKNATWNTTTVHSELAEDSPWQTVKVALSEQATGCTVAMQACVRGLSGLEAKLAEVNQAVEQAQQESREAVINSEAQADSRVASIKESEAKTREALQEELRTQLQQTQSELENKLKGCEQEAGRRLEDQQRVVEDLERANGGLRMNVDELQMEIAHNRERLAGFERCNSENGRLVQALEQRSKELEAAIATMVPPSKHSALERELVEANTKLANVSDEKDSAASELESLLSVIRELRLKLQEGEESNKNLEKENMKLCWQHVEWKTQMGAMQEAIRKRDARLLECESESEQRKSELMQVVSRSKSAQGDLRALQELVETIEGQRQNDARSHLRVVSELQRKNEELQQREAALRAHLEQLDGQLQRSRQLSLSGDTSKAVAGVAAVADELSGRLSKMRSTSPHRGLMSPLRR